MGRALKQGSYSLKLLKFHDFFHDLSEFSMAVFKPFFSRQYQNNHLFNIFSSIMLIFLLKLKPTSDSFVIFFNF